MEAKSRSSIFKYLNADFFGNKIFMEISKLILLKQKRLSMVVMLLIGWFWSKILITAILYFACNCLFMQVTVSCKFKVQIIFFVKPLRTIIVESLVP